MEIPESAQTWLANASAEHEMELEMLNQWYIDEDKELSDMGLKDSVTEEDFIDYVMAAVNAKIQMELGVPTETLETMVIGWYGPKERKGNLIADMVMWAYNPETVEVDPEPALVSAWNDQVLKRIEAKTLGCYKTIFGFDPSRKEAGTYKLTLQNSTSFVESSEVTWAGKDDKARKELLNSNYPIVPLGEADKNRSKLIQNEKSNSTYPNVLDLKRIRVTVVSYADGTKDNGIEWGRMSVSDKTFNPTPNHKSFTVWIDPTVARAAGAGPKSIVDIYGYLSRNMGDNAQVEMNACAVIPIMAVPFKNNAASIQKEDKDLIDNPGNVSISMTGVV